MRNHDLAEELLRRMEEDQEARRQWIAGNGGAHILRCNRENTDWFKVVLCQHGWPGITLVGEEAEMAAWVLAQHVSQDIVLQSQCLDLLIEAVDALEAPRWQVAYLTDRILVKRRRLQRYGTQYRAGAAGFEPQPIEELETLEIRRVAMGLPPQVMESQEIEQAMGLTLRHK